MRAPEFDSVILEPWEVLDLQASPAIADDAEVFVRRDDVTRAISQMLGDPAQMFLIEEAAMVDKVKALREQLKQLKGEPK